MRKTRFGIVGTGRISDWVLKGAVMEPRFEAAAVCSRSRESGKAFAEAHGIAKVYTDIDEMASDPEIDAIYIGTPNSTHHDLAILCMNHGKHVLCEKPMAANAKEVKEMIDVARANGVMLMEAMISTLCPNFVAARAHLAEMGDVRHYFASFCQYSSKYDLVKRIIAGEDDSPVPSSFNPDCCGGALMEPVEASSREGWKRVDLQGSVVFEYEGMDATAIYSKIADSLLRSEISCDGGIISLDQIHICRHAEMTKRGAPTSGRASGPDAVDISVPVDADEYLCEFREFIDVLESGRIESSVNSLETSLATAEILDEIRRQAGVVFPGD